MDRRKNPFICRASGEILECLRYTFLFGLIAHGMMLFNKLSWHDDLRHGLRILSIQKPIAMGRWFRALLGRIVAVFFGGANLSLPVFHGTVSILFIALSAYLIIDIFGIKKKVLRAILCGLMVCYPVVTSIFAYMFTAPYYFFALFLSVLAVHVSAPKGSWIRFLISGICICLSMGIYQPFLAVTVSLMCILVFFQIVNDQFDTTASLLRRAAYYIAICAIAFVAYMVIYRLSMRAFGISATHYQGFSTIGESGPMAYLHAFKRCYKCFFLRFEAGFENLFPAGIRYIQYAAIAAFIFYGALLILRQFKRSKLQALILALLALVLPICLNLIFVIGASSPDSEIHTLMLYAQVALYVFILCAIEHSSIEKYRISGALRKPIVAVLIALIVSHAYFDNACYLKAQVVQSQAVNYLNVLVARIKGLEGYSDTMPICFVKTGDKDVTITQNTGFSFIEIKPYDNAFLRLPHHFFYNNIPLILRSWCGFSPKYASAAKFKKLDEVKQMPDYPDAGSVKIIDDTVVIKW